MVRLEATTCCRKTFEDPMSRMLTFKDLRNLKGWPYSRQHTHKLIRAGHFPAPEKLYEGGQINVWDEATVDAHLTSKAERDTSGEAA
jgi:predicted DNA-binding transcriptional regulator AlpA